ncbi:MAG: hypothetical protein DIU63_09680, partial [Proteobacteria bacterium]
MGGKVKVPLYGNPNRAAFINTDATVGATIGVDLRLPDGSVPSLDQLALLLASRAGGVQQGDSLGNASVTLWRLIREVPPNVQQVEALQGAGLVTRRSDGTWTVRELTVADPDRLVILDGDGDEDDPLLDTGPDVPLLSADQTFLGTNTFAITPVVPDGSWAYAKIADASALSVLGRASDTSGVLADIQAGSDHQILRRSGNTIGFGSINLASPDAVGTSRLGFANLAQVTGPAVLGVSSSGEGNLAPIPASEDDRLLRRTSGELTWGQLTAGMFPAAVVPDAALSSNVPLKDAPNVFNATQTISTSSVAVLNLFGSGSDMRVSFWHLGAPENQGRYTLVFQSNGTLSLQTAQDSGSLTGAEAALRILRSVQEVTEIELNADALDFNGDADISGTLTVGGTISGNGSGLTNLNASNLGSGTLADARLSSNVALLDRTPQTFTGINIFRSAPNVYGAVEVGASAAISLQLGSYDTASADIVSVVNQITASGGLIRGAYQGHLVLALRENNTTDSVSIISGGGNYTSDTTYDTLVAQFLANGNTRIGGTLAWGGGDAIASSSLVPLKDAPNVFVGGDGTYANARIKIEASGIPTLGFRDTSGPGTDEGITVFRQQNNQFSVRSRNDADDDGAILWHGTRSGTSWSEF